MGGVSAGANDFVLKSQPGSIEVSLTQERDHEPELPISTAVHAAVWNRSIWLGFVGDRPGSRAPFSCRPQCTIGSQDRNKRPFTGGTRVESESQLSTDTVKLGFLGDVNGVPGRNVILQRLDDFRADHAPDLLVVNGENIRSGSGITPDLYAWLRKQGVDAVTLGDHVFRDQRILPQLEDPDEPISRPANLSTSASGKRLIRLPLPGGGSLWVFTILGRIFVNLPANDPFACVDELLDSIPEQNPLVMVEVHMEATSEKVALAHHLDGRVAAVLGTHTHVPTADARVLPGGTAFITDVGMCGPYDSVIGRRKEAVLQHMRTGMHAPFDMASGGEAMCGCVVTIRRQTGLAVSIERIQYDADYSKPPFR